ncbi:MAG: RnfABCDGE type electron transport complex subunit D [Chitinispirillaceae bacterium]
MIDPASNDMLVVSSAPHVRGAETMPRSMIITLAALLPAAAVAVMWNGVHSFFVIVICMAAAAATEWVFLSRGKKRPVMIDGSAAVTGLLLALSFPPQVPFVAALLGPVFAIAIVKMALGGLGRNFLNPALAGRVFCALSFPAAFAAAAPSIPSGGNMFFDLVIGHQSGWIGGFSAGALLAGAIVLRCLRIIDVTLPVAFAGSAYVLFRCFGGANTALSAMSGIGIGSLLLCAFFMATDPVTSPKTVPARFLFGAGCGILTFFLIKFGGANNSVAYAVLTMNLLIPYLDRYCSRVRKRCATN